MAGIEPTTATLQASALPLRSNTTQIIEYIRLITLYHFSPGVISAKVSLEDKLGIFEYDPSVTAPDLIKDYVDEMGFEASLRHPGMASEPELSTSKKVSTGWLMSQ